ncbi:MAG: ketoacyl-ACP synthase III [Treponema sp.]|jgi:3-oxoacyl-[acyl-carrier-protein] synthase-3|nr:ketoacyl-ACP synthase III [Treponema sp.]
MKAFIKAIARYLPEGRLSNVDLGQEFPEWGAEKILSKVGVSTRRIAAPDETATDMAERAARNLFECCRVDKGAVDYLLFCTQSPDYFLPASACLLQNRLGLSVHTGALDVNQGCSGYIYGLSLAKGLLAGGIASNVLLLTAETYSRYVHPQDKACRSIFGDGASATLIAKEGFAEIGEFCLGTDGAGAENLIVRTGGARNPARLNTLETDGYGNPVSPDHLYMNGGEIYSFTLRTIPAMVEETLRKNKAAHNDIDLFVFHQANGYMLEQLRKKLNIDKDKFFVNLSELGNTVSSSIPIALCEALEKGLIQKGTKILLAGFGVGLSWGGCVLT